VKECQGQQFGANENSAVNFYPEVQEGVIKKEEAFAAQWADVCDTDMSTRLLPEGIKLRWPILFRRVFLVSTFECTAVSTTCLIGMCN